MSTGKDKPATSESREWTLTVCSKCGAQAGASAHGHYPVQWRWLKVAVVPREDAEALATDLDEAETEIASIGYELHEGGLNAEDAANLLAALCERVRRAHRAYRLAHPGPEPEGTP